MYIYSIIIPHRNSPELLERLLDSIPHRDDVEIIIVDDNSDPSIVDFCSFPGNNRERTKIIFNKEDGRGAGRARNLGLEVATGHWLLFADADDYYTDKLYYILDKYADDDSTDIVYLNAQIFDENGTIRPHPVGKLIDNYLSGVKDAEMCLRYSIWTPWTRMVRREMVIENGLVFEEVPAANDKNFCLECSRHAHSISAESDIVYNYFKPHTKSQTDKKRNSLALDPMIRVRTHTNEIYEAVGYRTKASYLTLFYHSQYSRELPFNKCLHKYINTLKANRVGFLTDLFRFYRERISKKKNTV